MAATLDQIRALDTQGASAFVAEAAAIARRAKFKNLQDMQARDLHVFAGKNILDVYHEAQKAGGEKGLDKREYLKLARDNGLQRCRENLATKLNKKPDEVELADKQMREVNTMMRLRFTAYCTVTPEPGATPQIWQLFYRGKPHQGGTEDVTDLKNFVPVPLDCLEFFHTGFKDTYHEYVTHDSNIEMVTRNLGPNKYDIPVLTMPLYDVRFIVTKWKVTSDGKKFLAAVSKLEEEMAAKEPPPKEEQTVKGGGGGGAAADNAANDDDDVMPMDLDDAMAVVVPPTSAAGPASAPRKRSSKKSKKAAHPDKTEEGATAAPPVEEQQQGANPVQPQDDPMEIDQEAPNETQEKATKEADEEEHANAPIDAPKKEKSKQHSPVPPPESAAAPMPSEKKEKKAADVMLEPMDKVANDMEEEKEKKAVDDAKKAGKARKKEKASKETKSKTKASKKKDKKKTSAAKKSKKSKSGKHKSKSSKHKKREKSASSSSSSSSSDSNDESDSSDVSSSSGEDESDASSSSVDSGEARANSKASAKKHANNESDESKKKKKKEAEKEKKAEEEDRDDDDDDDRSGQSEKKGTTDSTGPPSGGGGNSKGGPRKSMEEMTPEEHKAEERRQRKNAQLRASRARKKAEIAAAAAATGGGSDATSAPPAAETGSTEKPVVAPAPKAPAPPMQPVLLPPTGLLYEPTPDTLSRYNVRPLSGEETTSNCMWTDLVDKTGHGFTPSELDVQNLILQALRSAKYKDDHAAAVNDAKKDPKAAANVGTASAWVRMILATLAAPSPQIAMQPWIDQAGRGTTDAPALGSIELERIAQTFGVDIFDRMMHQVYRVATAKFLLRSVANVNAQSGNKEY